jgi:hypothetical protein
MSAFEQHVLNRWLVGLQHSLVFSFVERCIINIVVDRLMCVISTSPICLLKKKKSLSQNLSLYFSISQQHKPTYLRNADCGDNVVVWLQYKFSQRRVISVSHILSTYV